MDEKLVEGKLRHYRAVLWNIHLNQRLSASTVLSYTYCRSSWVTSFSSSSSRDVWLTVIMLQTLAMPCTCSMSLSTCCLPRMALMWCNGMLWIVTVEQVLNIPNQSSHFIFSTHRCYSDSLQAYKYMETVILGARAALHLTVCQEYKTALPNVAAVKTWEQRIQ